jgi:peptidoglycan/xylan/chitin deacetylase (PgdA/CDA1 family)
MSIEELKEVDARGFSVESHGHGHINLAASTTRSATDDLASSVNILTHIVGRAPRFLAYPWGRVTNDVENTVSNLGFVAAFTIGIRDGGLFARARIPIRRVNAAWQFRLQTSGYWPALRFSRIGYPIRAIAKAFK